jgi:hypothetical protein
MREHDDGGDEDVGIGDTRDATGEDEEPRDAAGEDEEPRDAAGEDEEPRDAAGEDAPLADLAREVRERQASRDREREGSVTDPAAGATDVDNDDLFESVEVGDVDDEAVWAALADDESGSEPSVGLGTAPAERPDHDEAVVSKRDFCQRCPHFADPPETACTHEGTTIVEVLGSEEFRVRNCPVVDDDGERPSSSLD